MIKESKNIQLIQEVALGLDDLLNKFVFIGGSVAELYADDPAVSDIRPTLDVDCVVSLSTRMSYYELETKLRRLGFRNDTTQGAPICRWIYNGIIVDIMPTDSSILGFGNQWYEAGIRNKIAKKLPNNITVFVFPVEYYLATKLEALFNRGGTDLRLSHDFEDIVYILDNNSGLLNALESNPESTLKEFIKSSCERLSNDHNIKESVQSVLPLYSDSERGIFIIDLIKSICQLKDN